MIKEYDFLNILYKHVIMLLRFSSDTFYYNFFILILKETMVKSLNGCLSRSENETKTFKQDTQFPQSY